MYMEEITNIYFTKRVKKEGKNTLKTPIIEACSGPMLHLCFNS